MRSRSVAGGVTLALIGWLLVPAPAEAARPAAPFDLNGDGYADLVTGIPGESIGAAPHAGAIQVVYGSRNGLTASRAQLWSRATAGVAGNPRSYEEVGRGLASADFDRDGYADLAALTCTQVLIVYGSATGLSARQQALSPSTRADPCEFRDEGLRALVTGDFDDDGRSDLAVTASLPARVWVYAGTSAGLEPAPGLTMDKTPPTTKRESFDHIGNGLAAGDVDGDGVDDLAVGTGLGRSGSTDTGVSTIPGFFVVPGSASGLQPNRRQFIAGWRTPGLRPSNGTISAGFGDRLVIADLDRDGDGDLVVSDPEGGTDAAACDYACAGVVYVIPASRTGPVVRYRRYWSLSTQRPWAGDETYPEGNEFGAAMAVGDLDRDGNIDLAVAAPYDQSNYGRPGLRKDYLNPGNVYVVHGTENGLESRARQIWSQRSRGIPGQAKAWEGFGAGGLQILDVGRGRTRDLLVHIPNDRSGRGAVSVIYGSRAGLRADGAQLWHQDRPGIPGVGERAEDAEDHFGTL